MEPMTRIRHPAIEGKLVNLKYLESIFMLHFNVWNAYQKVILGYISMSGPVKPKRFLDAW